MQIILTLTCRLCPAEANIHLWKRARMAVGVPRRIRGEYCVAASGLATQPNCCNINLYRTWAVSIVPQIGPTCQALEPFARPVC